MTWCLVARLCRQNQLVQLRQTQFVDTTTMVNFQFAHLSEQILTLDACNGRPIGCCGWCVATFRSVLDQLVQDNLLLNANNSYLDYSSFNRRLQALFFLRALQATEDIFETLFKRKTPRCARQTGRFCCF